MGNALKKTETKSKHLELVPEIKPSLDLYEMLFHEANDAILLVDTDKKKIVSANSRLQDLTGFTSIELNHQDISQLFPSEETAKKSNVRSTLFSEETISHSGFYEDIVLLKKDGYLAFATLSVKLIEPKKAKGKSLAFCILHDMGEKKSMERDLLTKHWELRNAYEELERAHIELKSAQEALVQTGKLAALGELAAGVAHELNQPLAGIMGFAQELQRIVKNQNSTAEVTDFVEEIVKNSVRMKKIIQQLREFTRKSTEDFQNVNVADVINESLKLLDQQFKSRGICVNLEAEENIPSIYCNPFQLEQVFINLATNARDAIEATEKASGKIEIRVRRKPTDSERFIEITFKDDGIGMSTESKSRAFDPFYTTKEVGKGTGLGLSVSYGILSKINGTMMIESSIGKGTTFNLTLPVDYRTHNSNSSTEYKSKESNHG
ncbi:MAG: ATP-binding protein [Oligoflexia bacterium]|nr:ATP-binding protein [Oligoflexia bacterium]